MNWKQFLRTPLFFLVVHAVLIMYCVVTIGYLVSLRVATREIQTVQKEIVDAQGLKDVLNTQGNYLQSQTYKIKFIKEALGRKIKGEKVIDTATWETNGDKNTNYLPSEYEPTETSQWWDCLSGKQLSCFGWN
jgi:hypothetical protein